MKKLAFPQLLAKQQRSSQPEDQIDVADRQLEEAWSQYNSQLQKLKMWANGYNINGKKYYNPLTVNRFMKTLVNELSNAQQENRVPNLQNIENKVAGWSQTGTGRIGFLKYFLGRVVDTQQFQEFINNGFIILKNFKVSSPVLLYVEKFDKGYESLNDIMAQEHKGNRLFF